MAMIAVRRDSGADFIVPSVVHWKVDHYSAMVRRKIENGHEFFLLENPLFEREMWVSREALEEETSGYYLVPQRTLPSGWHYAAPREMARVWGKCFEGIMDTTQTMDDADEIGGPNGPTGCPDCQTGFGMATYSFHTFLTSLHMVDEPIRYSPPLGPSVCFRMTYDQRDASQPAIPSYSNLGDKWTFDWLSFVMDRGTANSQTTVFRRRGGQEIYQPENSTSIPGQIYTTYFNHDYESHAQLLSNTGVGGVLMNYQRLLPDGSQEIFSLIQTDPVSGNRLIFLTRIIDPAGNTVTINYDSQYRVVSVTDAIGQVTTLSYELSSDPLKVTKVTDPFGRSAVLTYNSQNQLASITDPLGIVSQFSYGDSDFINTLTTPYGVTQFTTGVAPGSDPVGGINRSLEATDPLGGTEHLEFRFYDPTQSGVYGTSFYWSKRAWATAPADPTAAFLINWMLNDHISLGIRHYQQLPNESRVSYSYASTTGQITQDGFTSGEPDFIGLAAQITKTLDDGSVQLTQFQYDEMGHPTKITDPANRVTSLVYDATGIDLLEIHNVSDNNALIGRFTYNNQHLPLTYTDASGQVTTYTYNSKGKLLMSTDAEGETTNYTYDSQSYLTTITGPLAGATTGFTHDKFGRTQSITDSQGYVLTFTYDALDHPTQVTYPDGTFDQVTYSNLDPVRYQDREGRAWQAAYDPLRRPLMYIDPLGNSTSLTWCTCGDLSQLTDANGNISSWQRDITSRVISRTYADGSTVTYRYGPMSGRLISSTDPNGQTANFQYAVDNNLLQMSFSNAEVPTAAISYTYDPNYNRVAGMQDGIGVTTYSYNSPGTLGALRVASVSGPWNNSSVTYSYDALGRVLGRMVDGAATGWAYDSLGRVTGETNPLGSFNATFVGATNRVSQVAYPNGQAINLTYYGNVGDERLQQIANAAAGPGVGSEFNYSYAAAGEMQSWAKITAAATGAWQFTYDAAVHLTGAASGGSGLSNYDYAYDPAANRTSEQSDAFGNSSAFNNLNQMVSLQQGASSSQLTYDANGNLLGDGTRTFEWDGLNRLTAVNIGSHRSIFSYDGQSRRVGIMEMDNGNVVANQQLVWCGDDICELRDSVSGTTRRFYGEGESDVAGGTETPYYYTFDHLGSVRELSDSTGALVTSYDYDPFGRLFSTGGARDATFGYAGYFVHAPSGLYLTKYRAYDPNLGTWLTRDPIGEGGGMNLYSYSGNDPIDQSDPSGLNYQWQESKYKPYSYDPPAKYRLEAAAAARKAEMNNRPTGANQPKPKLVTATFSLAVLSVKSAFDFSSLATGSGTAAAQQSAATPRTPGGFERLLIDLDYSNIPWDIVTCTSAGTINWLTPGVESSPLFQ